MLLQVKLKCLSMSNENNNSGCFAIVLGIIAIVVVPLVSNKN